MNVYEAKTQLSKLIERAAAGEEIIIAKAGQPRCRLVPLEAPAAQLPPRVPGRGKAIHLWIAEDFDELPEWFLDHFGAK